MVGVSDFENTLTTDPMPISTEMDSHPEHRPDATRLLAWVLLAWLLLAGAGLWKSVLRPMYRRQTRALRSMRESVEVSLAPGELLVVDDRLLAWALRHGKNNPLRPSVWTVHEDIPVSELLQRMQAEKTRELVVVATPEDHLIRNLDAAGFNVAEQVGWVPWDLKGDGLAMLGRGRMRVYFAVAPAPPKPSAKHKDRDVSSKKSSERSGEKQ